MPVTAPPPKSDETDPSDPGLVVHDTMPAIPSWTTRLSSPSRATLRRRKLLADLHVPMDGPVQLAQRIEGIPAATTRRRAGLAATLLCGDLLAGLGALGWAARSGTGTLAALGVALLMSALAFHPLSAERRGTSARHGRDHHLLSVRTASGIRTVDLAQLVHVEQRSRGRVRVLDANGVTAVITSVYGRQAVKRGLERWPPGQAVPSTAAQRRMLIWHINTLLRHPWRSRRRERESWSSVID